MAGKFECGDEHSGSVPWSKLASYIRNGGRRHGRSMKKLLDENETGPSRPKS